MMVRIKDVEIRDKSRMQVIINQEDGYINGTKLADQIGVSLHSFFNPDNIKVKAHGIM